MNYVRIFFKIIFVQSMWSFGGGRNKKKDHSNKLTMLRFLLKKELKKSCSTQGLSWHSSKVKNNKFDNNKATCMNENVQKLGAIIGLTIFGQRKVLELVGISCAGCWSCCTRRRAPPTNPRNRFPCASLMHIYRNDLKQTGAGIASWEWSGTS